MSEERSDVINKKVISVAVITALLLLVFISVGLAIVGIRLKTDETRRKIITEDNLRQVAAALALYAESNDGRFPLAFKTRTDLKTIVLRAGFEQAILNQPTQVENGLIPNEHLAGISAESVRSPVSTVTVSTLGYWYTDGGRTYAFVDGHVKSVPDKEKAMIRFDP